MLGDKRGRRASDSRRRAVPQHRLTRTTHAAAAAVEQALELVLRDGDTRGRFQPGGPGGPGNPRVRRMAELQTAIAEAVDPRMIQALMKRLVKQGLEGDVQAAKIVLERVAGKPASEQAGTGFDLPPIESASDIPPAFARLLSAAASGEVSTDDAARLASVLELTRKSIETAEFEARLRRVEEQQGLPAMRAV